MGIAVMGISSTRAPLQRAAAALMLCVLAMACGEVDIVGDVAAEDLAENERTMGASDANAGMAGIQAAADDGLAAGNTAATSSPADTACDSAASIFAQALCACEQVSVVGNLTTSTLSAAEPLAHVRVSGALNAAGFAGPLNGDLSLIGSGSSVLASEDARIDGSLRATTDLGVLGTTTIGLDAWLGGALLGNGSLVIEGDLHTPMAHTPSSLGAQLEVGGEARVESVMDAPPCTCDADATLDIAGWVASTATDNDNATAAFDEDALAALPASASVELPAGQLWVTSLLSAGSVVLQVSGGTALFVDGPLSVAGDLRAQLEPNAELAIFVAGDAAIGGSIELSMPDRPAAGRLYVTGQMHAGAAMQLDAPGLDVAGGVPVTLPNVVPAQASPARWVVNLYAPRLALGLSGPAEVSGALYVQSLVALGGLDIAYDAAVASIAEACDGP